MLSSEAAGGAPQDADPVAVSVELLHTFSLVHDDLMDRDSTRRGVASVHEAHDEATAILAGDALYSLAFEVLDELPETGTTARIATDLARTARRLCEGQQLDMAYEEEWPSVDAYESMIRKKTAQLFAGATRNGARAGASNERAVPVLGSFGEAFGLAFQVQDDVLDLVGTEEALGKPVGSDVKAGKKTHPLLEAHARAGSQERERLKETLEDPSPSEEDVAWVVNLVETTDALEASRSLFYGLYDQAMDHLEELPESPARAELAGIVDALMDRDR